MRRPEQQHSQNGRSNQRKYSRMADVLQVVKHGDLRAAGEQRRGEAGVQQ